MVKLPSWSACQSRRQPGITLLEVLVACGLLIIGLSTMASLLPAAGSRLAQATIEDRAGVLVTNAIAELTNRGLLAADAFGDSGRSLVLGNVLARLPEFTAAQLPASTALFTGLSPAAQLRCGSPRTFQLEDELIYGPPRLLSTPVNTFTAAADGVGPRRFREAICWGAMISPNALPPAAGGLARVSITVFRKDGGGDQMLALPLKRSTTHYLAEGLLAEDSSLDACSWVLALPAATSEPPKWFQVMSSWQFKPPADPSPRIIFRDQKGFETFTGTAGSGTTATVLAFEGLVRVDERDVILD